MFGSSEGQDVPKKRVSRRVVATPRVARRVVSSRTADTPRIAAEEERQVEPVAPTENRKAPTPLSAEGALRLQKRKQRIIVLILLCIGLGSSAAIGFLDQGQIDVEKTIEARNERIRNNQANEQDTLVSTIEVPVQDTNTQGKPDGGLIGRGTGGRAPVPEVSASSTATSTDQTASSTEAVASSTDEGTAAAEEVLSEVVPQEEAVESVITE
jgi:hypothetical protein